MTIETIIGIILLSLTLTGYIILKATGEMWHGVNWKYIWKRIRSIFR
jgi:hypothetical protein